MDWLKSPALSPIQPEPSPPDRPLPSACSRRRTPAPPAPTPLASSRSQDSPPAATRSASPRPASNSSPANSPSSRATAPSSPPPLPSAPLLRPSPSPTPRRCSNLLLSREERAMRASSRALEMQDRKSVVERKRVDVGG